MTTEHGPSERRAGEEGLPRPALPHLDAPLAGELAEAAKGNYAVLAPGAHTGGDVKSWTAEGFAEAARYLGGRGLRVLIIGAPFNREAGEAIAALEGRAINLAGRTSLAELYALMKGARVCLAVDSGAGHIAAAAAVPLLSLYSTRIPDAPSRWAAPSATVLLTHGPMAEHLPAALVSQALGALLDEGRVPESLGDELGGGRVSVLPPRDSDEGRAMIEAARARKPVLLLFRNGLGEVVITWALFQAVLARHRGDEIHCLCDAPMAGLLEAGAAEAGMGAVAGAFFAHPVPREGGGGPAGPAPRRAQGSTHRPHRRRGAGLGGPSMTSRAIAGRAPQHWL